MPHVGEARGELPDRLLLQLEIGGDAGSLAELRITALEHPQAIAAGAFGPAVARLGVLLRLDPALAPIILSAADRAAAAAAPDSGDIATIHLVRGDAYRVLGRDNEAAAAYQLAHQALGGGPSTKEPM